MVSLRHLSELCNGDVTSLHRGIWQHHRVTAIRIKFSFKSLVQNYEPKSRRMALELKDLEQANMNWSRMLTPRHWLCSWSSKWDAPRWCKRTAMGWPWGPWGQGTCPRLLDGAGSSLGHTRWRGGGWTQLPRPRAPQCSAAHQIHLGRKGKTLSQETVWSQPHPWLPVYAVSVAGSDVGWQHRRM